jgi:SCY1-like protein 2
MGSGISVNYDRLSPLFTMSHWKVSKAFHKMTNEPVSLWRLNYDSILSTGTKREKKQFVEASLHSVQQMKRLRHPSVLKILDSSDQFKALDFAAEPIMSCLADESSFSPDDASYLAYQIANVMAFINSSARVGMCGLSTHSICLADTLAIKVCVFTFSGPIEEGSGIVVPRLGDFAVSPFQPPLNFCSVEYVTNQRLTAETDAFSFGCVFASMVLNRSAFQCITIDEYVRETAIAIRFPAAVSPEVSDLVQACIHPDPQARPSFEQVLDSPAFRTMPLRSLQYVDMILTKTQDDKYTFFRGIAETLPAFSLRLLQSKMVPLFISEVLAEPTFGPVLIPLIFEIARSLEKRTFYREIFRPLAALLVAPDPPECLLAVLASLPIIIDQTADGRHYELCYPIVAAALSTRVAQLHREALSHMPKMVDKMPNETVSGEVVPALIDLFSISDDVNVVCSCVQSLADCLPKLAHDQFARTVIPRITAAWNRLGEPAELADACLYLVERLQTSIDVTMGEVVPMVSEVLASDASPPPTQLALCRYIKQATAMLRPPPSDEPQQNAVRWVPGHGRSLSGQFDVIAPPPFRAPTPIVDGGGDPAPPRPPPTRAMFPTAKGRPVRPRSAPALSVRQTESDGSIM